MSSRDTGMAALAAALFCFITTVTAGFNPSASNNLAVYWGQNSYQQPTGQLYSQKRLAYYCSNTNINIIPIAFMNAVSTPTVNFANAGDNCTAFTGTTLLSCPQLEEDIQICQSTYGKTILLSIGGATYTEGGFSSSDAAVAAADNIWAMFGPVQGSSSVNRPFNNSVVDGFDLDFESTTSNMAPFASELRAKMDATTAGGGKTYYLSVAPQCPYPDVANNDMLAGAVAFDFVMVQFYNNYCGLQSFVTGSSTQNNFNFDTWDNWAKTVSKNPNVAILLGIPGGSTAAGSGYTSGSTLSAIITYTANFSSFGGVMIWDMSQADANSGFLDQVVADLGSSTSTSTMTAVTRSTSRPSTTTTGPRTSTTASSTSGKTTSPTTTTKPTTTTTSRTTAATPHTATTSSTTKQTETHTSPTGSCAAYTVTVTVTMTVASESTTKTPCSTSQTKTTFTTSTITASETATPVKQWGQCGGIGYTGSTTCAAPYSCVYLSVWWAQCQ